MDTLRKLVREIPDFPKPGILFYDITTLLKDPKGLKRVINRMSEGFAGEKIDVVVGIEARGFIFAPAIAYHLGAGFVPVRKPKSSLRKPNVNAMTWNMAAIAWKSIEMRSSLVTAC